MKVQHFVGRDEYAVKLLRDLQDIGFLELAHKHKNFKNSKASTSYYVSNSVFFDNDFVTLVETDYCTPKQIQARIEKIQQMRAKFKKVIVKELPFENYQVEQE